MSDHRSNNTNALGLSRRALLAGAAGVGTLAFAAATPARAGIVNTDFRNLPPYGNGTLPAGVRARLIPNVNGLTVNILEAGFETPGRPLVRRCGQGALRAQPSGADVRPEPPRPRSRIL